MVVDRLRLPFPARPRVLEPSDELLLLGIHADDGIPAGGEFFPPTLDIGELPVAHPSGRRVPVPRFQHLAINAQGKSHLLQQPSHGTGAHPDMEPTQLAGNFSRGTPRPLQSPHRVARRFVRQ